MQGDVKSKPILFNTAMVQAILDGRKTMTRRVVKPQPNHHYDDDCTKPGYFNSGGNEWACKQCGGEIAPFTGKSKMKAPYQVGDVLWVRETWRVEEARQIARICIIEYKAGGETKLIEEIIALPTTEGRWRPSIHMPREAARIFLKVSDVRVERLRDITEEQALKEGIVAWTKDGWRKKYAPADSEGDGPNCKWADCPREYKKAMEKLWDSTIKKKDLDQFGWDANPFVWAVEFERLPINEVVKNA
ncbi:MAG: hypothetical protein CVU99_02540 [Firmicutes bacterium HGW-Firmicutes-4]|jgi:hypothetical protein|nr:MAG: hypothetical protein CVU99_02540 [Firmicutes bacterium HGW-Firmicutes-4]